LKGDSNSRNAWATGRHNARLAGNRRPIGPMIMTQMLPDGLRVGDNLRVDNMVTHNILR